MPTLKVAAENQQQSAGPTGTGGPANPDWRTSLPEELRADPLLEKIGDVGTLARGYIHAQKLVGGTKVTIPGKNATPEHWNEFWTKIGRPEKAEEYEMPKDGIPEGVKFDDSLTSAFFKEAHEAGLTKQQAARLLRFEADRQFQSMQAATAAASERQTKVQADLRKEFGKAFDQNIGLAKKVVSDFGGEELSSYLNETGLGDDPRVIRAFVKIGKAIASDEIIGTGSKTKFVLSPDEARREISRKQTDAAFLSVYQNANHPGHADAVREMSDLFKLVHGDT